MIQAFDKALGFTAVAFAHKKDRGGDIAVKHPLAVWSRVRNESEEVQVVAILHDIVEDTDWVVEDIRDHFGDAIAEAVDAISRREDESYWDYIKRVAKNPIAVKVKIADLMENSSPERLNKLPEKDRGVINRYNKALMFLRALGPTHETRTA